MNIRELLKRDHDIEVRISAGIGRREDPYVVESCVVEEAALTQLQLLRGIGRGLGELWQIVEWQPCAIGSATEVIRIEAVRFGPNEVETSRRAIYFDTRAVAGAPHALHPLTSWRGPPATPVLPYELGWLHFDRTLDNDATAGAFDRTIQYSGEGAKASIYVYEGAGPDGDAARDAEFKKAVAMMLETEPELEDPWPAIQVGPFLIKFFLSGNDMTVAGLAVSGPYFVKVRMTYTDDAKMRELMSATLRALALCTKPPA